MSLGLVGLLAPAASAEADSSWLSFTADKRPDLCLDASNGTGPKVQLWTCNGSDAQIWYWNGGLYQIRNKATGKCLSMEGGRTDQQTPLVLDACSNRKNPTQSWWYYNSKGTPIYTTEGNKLCVDIPNGNFAEGVQPWAYGCNNSDAQKFNAEWPKAVSDKDWLQACAQGYFPGDPNNTANCTYRSESYTQGFTDYQRGETHSNCAPGKTTADTMSLSFRQSRTSEDSTSVSVGLSTSPGILGSLITKVSLSIETQYGHKWSYTNEYTGTRQVTVNPGRKGALYVRVAHADSTGTYTVTLKNPVNGVAKRELRSSVKLNAPSDVNWYETASYEVGCGQELPATVNDIPSGGGDRGTHGAGNNGQRGGHPDGSWVTLVNQGTGRAVDSANGAFGDGNKIQAWNQHNPNEASQGWRLDRKGDTGDGVPQYALTSRLRDAQVLNLAGSNSRDVQLYHWDATANGMWAFFGKGDGWYEVYSVAERNKCLTDNGYGNQITIEPCTGRAEQRWGTYLY
ncbi:ricin-type beta-trefoil lectin domain protein [Kitasatospora sp. NPDC056800]|uniref:ricin-type beta-trefoil lectin domain protein n=1 Tax=Kitasatospora sp. NPDC056800 TaxID=3345948 RepID=UPI0036926C48